MLERKNVKTSFHGFSTEKKWEIINRLVLDAIDCHQNMGQDYYNGMTVRDYTMTPIGGTGPLGRPYDDFDIALKASEAGMKAIAFFSHFGPSYFKVPLIQKVVDDWAHKTGKRAVKVIGSVTINYETGGLNPEVVRMLVRFGGKTVYMPTLSGWYLHHAQGLKGGIELVQNGKVVPELEEIIGIMADNNLVMDVTFADSEQRILIVDEAKKAGVTKFKTYHMGGRGTTEEQWIELAKKGVKLSYAQSEVLSDSSQFKETLTLIRKVGVENCVGSTSLNNWPHVHPIEGLKILFMKFLLEDMSESDIELMFKINPTKLFDL